MEKIKKGILKIILVWKAFPKQMKRDAIEMILSIALIIWIPALWSVIAFGWVIKVIWDKIKNKPCITIKIKKVKK